MKKMMFQLIDPSEKNKIAAPVTLFKALGKHDQRQLMMGIELNEKQINGMKT